MMLGTRQTAVQGRRRQHPQRWTLQPILGELVRV